MTPFKPRKTHGMSGTPTYNSSMGMRQRCHNPNAWNYPHYGGRGIQVCNRWLESFENFLADMGEKPSRRHSIGRVDNDGDYTPENCRWETMNQQVRNKRWPDWTGVFEERKRNAQSESTRAYYARCIEHHQQRRDYRAWARKNGAVSDNSTTSGA